MSPHRVRRWHEKLGVGPCPGLARVLTVSPPQKGKGWALPSGACVLLGTQGRSASSAASTCVPEPAGARVSALLVSARRGRPVPQPCVLPAEGGFLSGISFSCSLPPVFDSFCQSLTEPCSCLFYCENNFNSVNCSVCRCTSEENV